MLQQTFGVDPAALDDPQWFALYAKYRYLEKVKIESITLSVTQALCNILNKIQYGQGSNTVGD